jgi:uncharacterized protein (TIGR03067 family)
MRKSLLWPCVVMTSLCAGFPGVMAAQLSPLPAPTGPYAVGRTQFDWMDESRVDLENENGHREIVVWVWYPASPQSDAQSAEWLPGTWGEMFSGWQTRLRRLNAPPGSTVPEPQKASDPINTIRTHAYTDAPVASEPGKYPVLLFSPGWGELPLAYATLIEEIVSHGYIVAGVVHTYCSPFTVFSDGRVAGQHEFARDLPGAPRTSWDRLIPEPAFRILTGDLRFTLNQLEQVNADANSPLKGRFDFDHVGVFGHSIGATAAIQVAKDDPRVGPAIMLDGSLMGDIARNPLVPKPLLLIFADSSKGKVRQPGDQGGNKKTNAFLRSLDAAIKSVVGNLERSNEHSSLLGSGKPSYALTIAETTHGSFADHGLIRSSTGRSESTKPVRALTVTSAYIKAFFDQHLNGKMSALLSGAADYPEATFERIVGVAADAPDEETKKEKQKLQGTWVAESVEIKGKADEKLKGARFNFSGDKVAMEFDGKKQEGMYTLDLTKSPKHIDLTFVREGRKDLDRGIYQIDGDTMKMCLRGGRRSFDRDGKLVEEKLPERPEKFDAKDSIITLKREKK